MDGDSITVLLNKNIVVSHQKLSTKPITIYLTVDLNKPFHELEMVAENLGRIPPNTSLMIVHDGDKRYEVRITSTEQKNAMVRFRYNKSDP